ncbi:LysR family hydrogen peroxide-inducible transcriptional activator [Rhodobium orientis]|uniref:LysR family transcriptional regulator n=1 Tax=Rhodobium orientis TaxID=34017 RepID=A0A327JJM6_9HYPH|nr:hydrogen peroxide-inducible genes activator [Rhodobium orientis]MBB4304716.1 LysR family hydrogen peroxide-inducible transcriptional activator [Rhodobium orientis]MBK5952080.1 LysR family transcriptional regulator [Rhodobium orientis]RAI26519.1 LysR family transcriptional regulator [Rhodobium orientis]
MRILPTLKQLEYLVALADTEHFGHAAEECSVTPSTLSAGIKDLETVLGIPLAERTKRSVRMTPLGREIAARSRSLLRDAGEIMAVAAAEKKPLSGDLRLGVIPTVGPYLLPRVLPDLRRKYPDLRLFLREEQTDDLIARLKRGDLDAAVIALPYDIEGLIAEPLFDDIFRLAVPAGHRLADKAHITQDDLEAEPLLLLEDGHCLRGHALSACQIGERRRRSQFESTSLYTLVQMIAAGIGVTLLPQLAIDSHIAEGTDIVLRPLDGAPSRGIGLIWRAASLRAGEFRLLARELVPEGTLEKTAA